MTNLVRLWFIKLRKRVKLSRDRTRTKLPTQLIEKLTPQGLAIFSERASYKGINLFFNELCEAENANIIELIQGKIPKYSSNLTLDSLELKFSWLNLFHSSPKLLAVIMSIFFRFLILNFY